MSEGKNIPRLRFPEFYGSWEKKKLEDVGKIRMCKRIFNHQTSVSGDIPFYKIGTFGREPDSYISKELYHEFKHKYSYPKVGDILISAAGTLGRTVVFDGSPSYFQDSNIVWIDNKENLITNQFLYYIYKIVRYESEGGTIQRLYNSIIYNAKFWKPSLPEQQKIADFLTAVDKRIELLEKKKSLLETYKKGVMKKIFNQEIRFKDDNGKDFPNWEYKQMSEVFQIMTSSSKSRYIDDSGVYFVMDMGGVDSNGKLTHHKKTSLDQDLIEPGLLVMPKDDIGGGNIIGKVGIIEKENTYVLGDHVYGLKTQTDEVVRFLYYSINSYEVNRSLRIKSTGTSQLGLNKKNVEKQIIPLPSKSEQKKISEFLTSIDIQIELLETQIEKSKTWKKGLLQKMFV